MKGKSNLLQVIIMRKYALLEEEINNICKVMICKLQEETYVFLYNTTKDAPCFADLCFDQLEEAEEYCKELGVKNENWVIIDDPIEGCQDDLVECL
jgi:hypothetical protein